MIFLPSQTFDKGLYLFIYLFIHSSTKIFHFFGRVTATELHYCGPVTAPFPINVPYSFRKALWVIYVTAHWAQLTFIDQKKEESAETWGLVEDKAELYQKVWSRSRN